MEAQADDTKLRHAYMGYVMVRAFIVFFYKASFKGRYHIRSLL